jgi:putative SOS response-associated peptidase YedK
LIPWSFYSLADGRPFFMAGLWLDAPDPATGEIAGSYTMVIGEANAARAPPSAHDLPPKPERVR